MPRYRHAKIGVNRYSVLVFRGVLYKNASLNYIPPATVILPKLGIGMRVSENYCFTNDFLKLLPDVQQEDLLNIKAASGFAPDSGPIQGPPDVNPWIGRPALVIIFAKISLKISKILPILQFFEQVIAQLQAW